MTKVLFSLPTGLVKGIGKYVSSSSDYKSRQEFYQSAIIRWAAEHGVDWEEEDVQVQEV